MRKMKTKTRYNTRTHNYVDNRGGIKFPSLKDWRTLRSEHGEYVVREAGETDGDGNMQWRIFGPKLRGTGDKMRGTLTRVPA